MGFVVISFAWIKTNVNIQINDSVPVYLNKNDVTKFIHPYSWAREREKKKKKKTDIVTHLVNSFYS